jgi:hypothetical protein
LKIFAVFRNLYLFISRFMAESWLVNTGFKFLCHSHCIKVQYLPYVNINFIVFMHCDAFGGRERGAQGVGGET